jgi:hypothetical protein
LCEPPWKHEEEEAGQKKKKKKKNLDTLAHFVWEWSFVL